MTNELYYIKSEDVGKQYLTAFGEIWEVKYFATEIRNEDVGKWIRMADFDILEMESDEAFNRRSLPLNNLVTVRITLHIRACVTEARIVQKLNELIANATTEDGASGEWTRAVRWTIERD